MIKRVFGIMLLASTALTVAAQNEATVNINAASKIAVINRNIYGHFSEHLGHCIYGGLYVGKESAIPNTGGVRNDIIEALKRIRIPNLRWPGGCFADEYHWRDGVGPLATRPKMVNTNWGGVVEDNSFGTHEFLNLCETIGAEPYISGNVGSGTVEEMAKWVEYMTSDGESPMANLRRQNGRDKPWKVQFFGVGNESWGCGGNMTPSDYATLFRRYQTYCRNYGSNRLFKIASGANVSDYGWTETLMKSVPGWMMQGISLHHYTFPNGWDKKGPATSFSESDYAQTIDRALFMDELIVNHSRIMDKYDPDKRVGLIVDEWGTWFNVEPGTNPGFLYQQNTLRDALVAGITLNIFHKHADRVQMANIAQLVNVLQALFLTEGDKMILTPTYHVFDMYKVHQNATSVETTVSCGKYRFSNLAIDQISASTSIDKDGVMSISLVNVDMSNDIKLTCNLNGFAAKGLLSASIITSKDISDHNTFDSPGVIALKPFKGAALKSGTVTLTIPAKSIVTLSLK